MEYDPADAVEPPDEDELDDDELADDEAPSDEEEVVLPPEDDPVEPDEPSLEEVEDVDDVLDPDVVEVFDCGSDVSATWLLGSYGCGMNNGTTYSAKTATRIAAPATIKMMGSFDFLDADVVVPRPCDEVRAFG